MRLDVKIDPASLASVRRTLESLSGKQLAVATAKALNDTGFHVRRAMQAEIKKAFDAPTSYITSSPRVQMAKPERLTVGISPTYQGGKGIDPQKILQAQEFGGRRADKRSERALRRIGVLPSGYITVIPEQPLPGSDDGKGNLRGAFVAQLLSYLQAGAAEGDGKGYRSNMTRRRINKLADRTQVSSLATRKTNKVIRGVVYFVSYGKLRSGPTEHLAPGVWAKSGTHGVQLRPVLMFVRDATYTPRLSMERIADTAGVQEYMERRFRFRIREAAGV